jgi:RNA binding exosome subunit
VERRKALAKRYAESLSRFMETHISEDHPIVVKWSEKMEEYLSNPIPILEKALERRKKLIERYRRLIERHEKAIARIQKLIELRRRAIH